MPEALIYRTAKTPRTPRFRRVCVSPKIVKDILEDDLLYNLYDGTCLADLSSNKIKEIKQRVIEEKEQIKKERSREEERSLLNLVNKYGGTREVPIFYIQTKSLAGIADLLTQKQIIEENISKIGNMLLDKYSLTGIIF
ncbi:MAG: hypothetical protein KME64_10230 [Scytonematopsis contorta HA4267-MV1]|nr:hypothetical protein [Scytonematopsis contorta HA4267-MV1]